MAVSGDRPQHPGAQAGAALITPPDDIKVEAEGCNGRMWTLAGEDQWDQGVALADEDEGTDFDGMYDAPFTAIYNSTAFEVGARFGGIREEKYDFILAVHVMSTPQMNWRDVDSEFRLSWSAKRDSKLWVKEGDSRRCLPVRLGGKTKIKATWNPKGEQYGLILLPLIGAYPRWMGEPLISTFTTTTDTTESGFEIGYVKMGNPLPEDYEIWPEWRIQAAAEGMVVELPDYSHGSDDYERAEEDALRKLILAPLLEDEHLLVRSDKMAFGGPFVSSLDTQFHQRMGGRRLCYPIPGRTPNALYPVKVSGAPIGTKIQVQCPRPWPRPWGLE